MQFSVVSLLGPPLLMALFTKTYGSNFNQKCLDVILMSVDWRTLNEFPNLEVKLERAKTKSIDTQLWYKKSCVSQKIIFSPQYKMGDLYRVVQF